MNETWIVTLHGVLAGYLTLNGSQLIFRYADDYLDSKGPILSQTLPLSDKNFDDVITRPFFSNLLPEGDLRQQACHWLGVSESNDFALLKALAGECAGALSLIPPNTPIPDPSKGVYQHLPLSQLATISKNNPLQSWLFDQDQDVRLSLAGAQHKVPLFLEGEKLYLPKQGAPSSHILKPSMGETFPGLVVNEFFCNRLAHEVGLLVPKTQLYHGHFLIKRYDRMEQNGQLMRLHQEDFCQALGFSHHKKYQSEGGPDLKACFQLLTHSNKPAMDRQRLMDWVIFNVLIHNADAHAKNISILYEDHGFRLAPLYDLVCTKVYPGLSQKFAMKIGGENRSEWLQQRHWQRFAQSIDFKETGVMRRLKTQAKRTLDVAHVVADSVMELTGDSVVLKVLDVVVDQCERVLKSGW